MQYKLQPKPTPGDVTLNVVMGVGQVTPPIVKIDMKVDPKTGKVVGPADLNFVNDHKWAQVTVVVPGFIAQGPSVVKVEPGGGRATLHIKVPDDLRNVEIPYEVFFYDPERHGVRGMGKGASPPSMVVGP